ncbi:hypothetical protein KO465_04220 [Candidatus Micrarchaeota archaeon]|nr:hypothetical protein [Candidatus Micrarchaeota archaeon]
MKKILFLILITVFFLFGNVIAFQFDEGRLNNCLCQCGCSADGWACYAGVSCYYHPAERSSSPNCMDTSLGVCVCEGFGCGRAQIATSGDCYDNCIRSYGEPVCGDGNCETNKDENCETCPSDCACTGARVCDPTDKWGADNQGCKDGCGDGVCVEPYETGENCPKDCINCGDYYCYGPENLDNCPEDCWVCPDGICTPPIENITTCWRDCVVCGDGICSTPYETDKQYDATYGTGCPQDCGNCNGNGVCDPGENDETCPSDCIENCYNNRDDDRDGLIDCDDPDCFSESICMPPNIPVSIRVLNGKDGKPLKNIQVSLFVRDNDIDFSPNPYDISYANSNGIATFEVDQIQYKKPIYVYALVEFKDEDGVFQIINNDPSTVTYGKVVSAPSPIFEIPWGSTFDMVMKTDARGVDTSFIDPSINSRLTDISYIYWNTKDIIEYFENDLEHELDTSLLPVKIYVFSPRGTTCEACYRYTTHEIFFDEIASVLNDPTAPENREWHEFTHHMNKDLYGLFPSRGTNDVNHAGFKNEMTTDSYTEAFAELWPVLHGGDGVYGGFYTLDSETKAWGRYGTDEELAFLSLMWRLQQEIFYDELEFWNFLGDNKPTNSQELYNAVLDEYPDEKETMDEIFIRHGFFRDSDIGNKKYDAGEPWWDKSNAAGNYNRRYDIGEKFIDLGSNTTQVYNASTDKIGAPSNYERPNRNRRPNFWFNFVKLDVKDKSGNKISDAAFSITYQFTGTCTGSTFTEQAVIRDDRIYILFPNDFESCNIQASISPNNYENLGNLLISQQEMETYMDHPISPEVLGESEENYFSEGYVALAEIIVGNKIEYCNNNGKCDPGETASCVDCAFPEPPIECYIREDCSSGLYCNAGSCSSIPPSTKPSPVRDDDQDDCCAGFVMLFILMGAGFFASSRYS